MRFANSVGVAPGTTTMQIGLGHVRWDPYATGIVELKGRSLRGLRDIDTRAVIRWDLMGIVGGTALALATIAGVIASKLR
jgi:hypothetical protein